MSDPVSLFRLHEAGYRAMAQLSVCCSPMFLFTTFPDADEVLIERLPPRHPSDGS